MRGVVVGAAVNDIRCSDGLGLRCRMSRFDGVIGVEMEEVMDVMLGSEE